MDTNHNSHGRTRIPASLQAVFLASNRGKEVHKPPPGQVCSKVFFTNWYMQRKSTITKRTVASGARQASRDTKRELKAPGKNAKVRAKH
jgi:hypothetical protein